MTTTIDDIRAEIASYGNKTPEYWRKQMHQIPNARIVDRQQFIVERCRGKGVLDVGASGALHLAVRSVAREYWGIDHPSNDSLEPRPGVFYINLDHSPAGLPTGRNIDLIVCGEVVEHLSNPGRFLEKLLAAYPAVPVIFTVPNAFSHAAQYHLRKGYENVNLDHVAWYSPKTLGVLLARVGYKVREWYGYNGRWPTCEGIIAVAE